MKRRANNKAIATTILFSFVTLFIAFYELILSPQKWIFAHLSGDGLKNYFTVMYYSKYDDGLLFSGMNYPYGEYLHYIDCHPFLSLVLGFVHRNIISIDHLMPALLSYWLLLLIPIGAVVIYLLLRQFTLPRNYAILCALIITFLSPQLDRISDHHALSYIFIIPLAWLFFIKMYQSKGSTHIYGIALTILFVFSGWIHAYYVPIIGFFLLSLYGFILLTRQVQKKNIFLLLYPIIGILIAYLSFSLLDPYDARSAYPWGIGVYNTTWEGMLLPSKGLIHHLIMSVVKIRETSWEGQAFVGTPFIFILLFSIIHIIRKWANKSRSRITTNKLLLLSVLSAFSLFLFGTGFFHFYILKGHEELLKPLFQFRSLGRFAWAAYYPFGVFTAYMMFVLYRYVGIHHSKKWAILLISIALSLWAFDAGVQLRHEIKTGVHENLMLKNDDTLIQDLLKQSGRSIEDFQASLPIPYTNIGAKLLTKYDGTWVFGYAMRLAYLTHTPIIGLFTARPALKHSIALRQLFSSPYIKKDMLSLMNDKPILIIHKGEINTQYEKKLISKADLIVQNEKFDLYQLSILDLDINYSGISYQGIALDSLILLSKSIPEQIIPPKSNYIYESLDDLDYKESISGKTTIIQAGPKLSSSLLIDIKGLDKSKTYNVSFWIEMDNSVKLAPVLKIRELNNKLSPVKTHHIWWRFESDVYKKWLRVNRVIKLNPSTESISFDVSNNDIRLDELLIQEVGSDYIINKNNKLLINNYIIDELYLNSN